MLEERARLYTDLTFRGAAYDTADAAVVILDEDRKIVASNTEWYPFQAATGAATEHTPGNLGLSYRSACRSMWTPEDTRAVLTGIHEVLSGTRAFYYMELETTPDPASTCIAVHVAPLVDRTGLVSVIHEDVTERMAAERQRLKALAATQLMGTPPESEFDEIVERASRVFGVPIALFTLIDEERQWFKAKVGIDVRQTARSASFCAHALFDGAPLVVEDATKDRRFEHNVLVVNEPRIRFYAGVPVRAPGGEVLGTLCIVDRYARAFPDDDLKALIELAGELEQRLKRKLGN